MTKAYKYCQSFFASLSPCVQPPSGPQGLTPAGIETVTLHRLFEEPYSRIEHFEGELQSLGDALGTDRTGAEFERMVVIGQAFHADYLASALEHIASHPGVWLTSDEIAEASQFGTTNDASG